MVEHGNQSTMVRGFFLAFIYFMLPTKLTFVYQSIPSIQFRCSNNEQPLREWGYALPPAPKLTKYFEETTRWNPLSSKLSLQRRGHPRWLLVWAYFHEISRGRWDDEWKRLYQWNKRCHDEGWFSYYRSRSNSSQANQSREVRSQAFHGSFSPSSISISISIVELSTFL